MHMPIALHLTGFNILVKIICTGLSLLQRNIERQNQGFPELMLPYLKLPKVSGLELLTAVRADGQFSMQGLWSSLNEKAEPFFREQTIS